jgi:hypothetical protein
VAPGAVAASPGPNGAKGTDAASPVAPPTEAPAVAVADPSPRKLK